MRRWPILSILALLTVLAGCGDDGPTSVDTPPGTQAVVATPAATPAAHTPARGHRRGLPHRRWRLRSPGAKNLGRGRARHRHDQRWTHLLGVRQSACRTGCLDDRRQPAARSNQPPTRCPTGGGRSLGAHHLRQWGRFGVPGSLRGGLLRPPDYRSRPSSLGGGTGNLGEGYREFATGEVRRELSAVSCAVRANKQPVIPILSRDLDGDGGPMAPRSARGRCRVLGTRAKPR